MVVVGKSEVLKCLFPLVLRVDWLVSVVRATFLAAVLKLLLLVRLRG